MAKNELLPFADGEDANVLPTAQWEALTDILENGFQSGIAKSEQVNRVLAQGAVASYVLGQLIVDQLNKDATLDKDTLYQNLVSALQENAKDVCLPLGGGKVVGDINLNGKGLIESGSAEVRLISNTESGIEAYSSNSQYKGITTIIASDGEKRRQLIVNVNGDATWAGKSLSAMGFPSGNRMSVGVGSSGSIITAPEDGWLFVQFSASTGTKYVALQYANLEALFYSVSGVSNGAGIVPVRKGESVKVLYTASTLSMYFIRAEGRNF